MRIVLINDYREFGGAEKIFNQLGDEINKVWRANQVFSFTLDDLPIGWGGFFYGRERGSEETRIRYMKREFQKIVPDVLHVHNFSMVGTAPIKAALDMGIPVVYTAHDYFLFCPSRILYPVGDCPECYKCMLKGGSYPRFIRRFMFQKRIMNCKKELMELFEDVQIVTISSRMGKIFESAGFENRVVFNGIKAEFPEPTDDKLKYFIHLGRLTREKGPYLLAEVSKRIPIYAFNKGSLDIISKIDKSGIDYRGYRSKREVMDYLRFSRGLISCSVWPEPWGLDITEAMMYGKPVVATRVGGHMDQVLNDRTGFLVDPDPKQLTDAATEILLNDRLARKMGNNGRLKYELNFTIEKCAGKYMEIYKNV